MSGKKECGSIEERCDKESRCGTDANLTRSNIHPCLKKGFAEPPPRGCRQSLHCVARTAAAGTSIRSASAAAGGASAPAVGSASDAPSASASAAAPASASAPSAPPGTPLIVVRAGGRGGVLLAERSGEQLDHRCKLLHGADDFLHFLHRIQDAVDAAHPVDDQFQITDVRQTERPLRSALIRGESRRGHTLQHGRRPCERIGRRTAERLPGERPDLRLAGQRTALRLPGKRSARRLTETAAAGHVRILIHLSSQPSRVILHPQCMHGQPSCMDECPVGGLFSMGYVPGLFFVPVKRQYGNA